MSSVRTQLRKPAEADYPVMDLIKQRFSPRAFDSRPIEKAKLLTILEAARWTPSARNAQPWRFIVASRENEPEFQKMLSILKEGNQSWAKDAAVLILAVTQEEYMPGHYNGHAEHDTGQALAYITMQALDLDIHLRMMGGFYPEKAREAYHIPASFKPMTVLALGYLGTLEQLDELNQQKEKAPRHRKPLSEMVFSDNWDNLSDLVK